jgi:hypothetical protein
LYHRRPDGLYSGYRIPVETTGLQFIFYFLR